MNILVKCRVEIANMFTAVVPTLRSPSRKKSLGPKVHAELPWPIW